MTKQSIRHNTAVRPAWRAATVAVFVTSAAYVTFARGGSTPRPVPRVREVSVEPDTAAGPVVVRAYDVRDLLTAMARDRDAAHPDWRAEVMHGDPQAQSAGYRSADDALRSELGQVVMYHVTAAEWEQNGKWRTAGPAAVRWFGGVMVVRQTPAGQRAVRAWLDVVGRR